MAAPTGPAVRTEERPADPPRCDECAVPHDSPAAYVWDRPCAACPGGHRLCGRCARELGMEETGAPWEWPHCPDAARLALELSGGWAAVEEARAKRVLARFGGEPRDVLTNRRIHDAAEAAGLPVRSVGTHAGGTFLELADGRQVGFPR